MKKIARSVALWISLFYGPTALGQSTDDRFFDSNGARIRYQIWGQGSAVVVLIHGFGETLESWKRGEVVRLLSPHFKLLAIDVRGHGQSSKPHEQKVYGAELSGDIVRLLRHVGAAKAHIVGYSLGGLVALDFAVFHQKHALSIVLGGAGWNPPETLNEFKRQAEALEQGTTPAPDRETAKALAALLRSLRFVSEEELQQIEVPVAAIIGADDRFMSNVHRLARVLPNLCIVTIPEVDHTTAPRHPKFAEALAAFLLEQNNASD